MEILAAAEHCIMKRTLARYNEMRDFSLTEEPSGAPHRSETGRSFVVQKHAATALHYDFRLELDGVLLSWAVPKGPSLSPKDKRLAVQVEDHPVDYRDFEGKIPKGEYGGGPVIVWDRGTWTPIGDPRAGLEKGRLELSLHGDKLHGTYMLVRLAERERDRGKKNWLLIKRSDEFVREGAEADIVKRMPRSVLTGRTIEEVAKGVPATKRAKVTKTKAKAKAPKAKRKTAKKKMKANDKRAPLPAFGSVAPQLATLVDDVPLGENWVYELKYDGYRAIATLDHGDVRIATRSGQDWTERFAGVAKALSHVRAETAVFDGEIAYVDETGKTDFQKLQNALGRGGGAQLVYFVFDLLHYDGVDLTTEPLLARKDTLRTLLAGEGPPLKMGEHMRGDGKELLAQACKLGLEGIIGKRADRPYRGGRSTDWVKVKCQKRQEMVIIGATLPKGARTGIGALLLAVHDESGGYRYAGKVGTGFSQASLADLDKRLAKLAVDEPAAKGVPRIKGARWVRPELVCQVRFTEWTRDGSLRHPSFEGLREDKAAPKVVREVEKHLPRGTSDKVTLGSIVVTHPERVVDKESGITKGDVARYTAAVVEHVLPFAKKRPLMLLRCTEAGSCFVQKHSGRGLVDTIGRGDVEGEEVLFVTKREEVFALVQHNAIELHGWGCRMPRYDRPDWIVFDLDPDVGLPFERVVAAAIELRDELAKMKLTTFVKTTGGKGLHVVVPLTPKDDWEVVGAFAQAVAEGMVKREPRAFVATMSKAARKGKIFIDHFRNGRGATAILPYSPRARPGVPVAMPLTWKELASVDPEAFTVLTVPELLARRRIDPWADLLETKQTIPRDLAAALKRAAR
jgi:bifunctional non-homologous end joining protein LigD